MQHATQSLQQLIGGAQFGSASGEVKVLMLLRDALASEQAELEAAAKGGQSMARANSSMQDDLSRLYVRLPYDSLNALCGWAHYLCTRAMCA